LNGPYCVSTKRDGNAQNWTRIRTIRALSNRGGVGTRLIFQVGTQVAIHEVRMGSSYLCSRNPRVLLGVSDHELIDKIEVHWPSGIIQIFKEITVNQQLDITEKGIANLN